MKQLVEMNEKTKQCSETNYPMCLPCAEDTNIRDDANIQDEELKENSIIIFEDGEEEVVEIDAEVENQQSKTATTALAAKFGMPQPAVTTNYETGEKRDTEIPAALISGEVEEMSVDRSLEEVNWKKSIVTDSSKMSTVQSYEKDDNSWSEMNDLCMSLQLCSLCTEDEVLYAGDNFDKTEE